MAEDKQEDRQVEQSVFDSWAQWVDKELVARRASADRAYKRALQIGDEPAWQHAEIVERSYGQLEEMKVRQDPYFARIRGRMKDVDGEPFEVDLRVHRYHRSEAFPLLRGGEMLDISHLAPLADLVRNPSQKELVLTLRDREFLDLVEKGANNPHIEVVDCRVEDIELEEGRVVRVAPRYGAIFEDRVRKRLGQAATPALDILADVLDQEQNAIIADRDPKMQLIILDGPAGTGKTVVAAHRIAVAADPESPGIYLTPTTTLRDYVRPVLPRLGLERTRANAWSLADLAAMMWPDFPWAETLLGIVPESPWNRQDWTDALNAAQRGLGRVAPERLYREAAKILGAEVPATFGLHDVAPLLWLGAWMKRPRPVPEPNWVIIDEAQAIPILAYEALRDWFGPGLSWILAGDLMQQGTHHDWDGWTLIQEALGIGSRRVAHLWLSRSYRVPPKIHAAAERLRLALNPNAKPSESVPWHINAGTVSVCSVDDSGKLTELVKTRLKASVDAGIISIALLAPTDQRLRDWERGMTNWPRPVQVLRGSSGYTGGVVLATLDMVRGLEFDAVIILDVTETYYPDTPAAARTLYTSMTRARRTVDFVTVSSSRMAPSPWLVVVGAEAARR